MPHHLSIWAHNSHRIRCHLKLYKTSRVNLILSHHRQVNSPDRTHKEVSLVKADSLAILRASLTNKVNQDSSQDKILRMAFLVNKDNTRIRILREISQEDQAIFRGKFLKASQMNTCNLRIL